MKTRSLTALCRIDPNSAAAVFVNSLSVPLTGTFGVDFNPAADRLRIIGNDGQNLRHNVNTGGTTLADTALNYAPDAVATGLAGAAYTNKSTNLLTGRLTFMGRFATEVVDVAVPLAQ